MSDVFLTAEWRKLIMANYPINPEILKPYLPHGAELDFWEGKCYVSLVGFLFDKVKLKGISIPFHTRFEEVNLRFYIRFYDGKQWQRGVVFVSEIVPMPAIAWVANTIYGEKYSTMPMKHTWEIKEVTQTIRYDWQKSGHDYFINVQAGTAPRRMAEGSQEHFIFEHYWGLTNRKNGETGVYRVAHPSWETYKVNDYHIRADFAALYGKDFSLLNDQEPESVFLAEGSPVQIFKGGSLENHF